MVNEHKNLISELKIINKFYMSSNNLKIPAGFELHYRINDTDAWVVVPVEDKEIAEAKNIIDYAI